MEFPSLSGLNAGFRVGGVADNEQSTQ